MNEMMQFMAMTAIHEDRVRRGTAAERQHRALHTRRGGRRRLSELFTGRSHEA